MTRAASEEGDVRYRPLFGLGPEEGHQRLVEHLPEAVVVHDHKKFLYVNCAGVKLLGASSPEELAGRQVPDFVPPECRQTVEERMARVHQRRTRAELVEEKLVRLDGAVVEVEATAIPISYEGKPAVLAVVRDVTQRNRVEEIRRQRDFCETLLEAQSDVGEGLLVVEGERIRYANRAFCLMSGYSAEELASLPSYLELATEDQRPVLEHRMLMPLLGEAVEDRYETAMLHRSGRRVELEVGVRLLPTEGQRPHLVAVVRDITASKRVKERLQSSLGMMVAVHEAGRVLSSSLSPAEIGKRLLEVMHRVSDLDAAILRARDERGRLSVVHACGSEGLLRAVSAVPEAQSARLRALKTGQYQPTFRLAQPKEAGAPVVGLCLPLVVRERVTGVLEAYGPEALAEEMVVETLRSLAGQAASALENACLYQELAERERRLKDLVGELIGAKEEERHRVAYEIHDGLTQAAVAVHQHLQAFAKGYIPDSASSQTKLDSTLELARQAVREARSVIADLRPTAPEDFGLAVALRSKVEALRADGWEIGYVEALGGERLPNEIEVALYRVAQEALTNVRKHAQTTRARVTLARRDKSAYLEVWDSGRGFDQCAAPKDSNGGERVGICGMRERIALLDGDFAIRSRPGAGTRVVAEVPLPRSEGVNGKRER